MRSLRPKRIRGDEGISLLEMVVALTVLSLLAAALLAVLLSTSRTVRSSKQRATASTVASSVVDEARAQGATALTPGRTTETRTANGRTFTVVRDAQFVTRGSTGDSCTSPGVPSFLRVRVTVSWPGMGSIPPVEANTLLTPGIGDVDADTGNVAVTVVDRDGAPKADVPVTLTSGTTAGTGPVQRTTADGCAFFAFVAPGTFTASVHEAGWVDATLNTTPAVTTSVTASKTATVSIQYDQGGALTLLPNTDALHPAPNNLRWTLYSTAFTNATQTRTFDSTGVLPFVINPLFPAKAGYTGWAGRCVAADPGLALRPAPVMVDRGGAASLTANVAKFEITASRGGAPLPAGWQITATPTPTTGCPAGESYTWVAPGAGMGTLGGALPFGTWTLTVRSGTRTGVATVVLSPATIGVTTAAVTL